MKIVVYTLGCKVNQYESDGLIHELQQNGHQVFDELCFADVYIINTCAVTNEAEKKSRQTISKCRALNNTAKIIVCGCASQKNQEQFKNLKVDFIKGTINKKEIIQNLQTFGTKVDEFPLHYEKDLNIEPSKVRSYIKIQDGCNNFCSYCIIPYLRGRSRSKNINDILQEVEILQTKVKEIVITGIDITDYKIDNKRALPILLQNLKKFKDTRFRLGSLEQGLIDQNFIDTIKNTNICPHFHLSLQSGSDTVLKRMNRKYLTKDYLQSINLIKENIPNATITTDIIVGFPEETEKEFLETCEFVKKVGFYNIHIFPYSLRSGTLAEKMLQIDGNIKKQRVSILTQINNNLNKDFINKIKDKNFEVLIEEFDGKYYIGHTENYIKCYISEKCEINEFVKIKIKEHYKDGAIAQREK